MNFLEEMAHSSAQRAAAAMRIEPFGALERRALATPPAPRLHLSHAGFDVIAELKLRSPAAGKLADDGEDWLRRIVSYARGGAVAVSVLTEPSRFDGTLEHLRQASTVLTPLRVPAMRKDFLVDPYQVLEARAAGAGGLLLILRMLSQAQCLELLDAAAAHGLFVLLEAFDVADLLTAREILAARPPVATPTTGRPHAPVLIGVNCRDLATLQVVPQRFATLAPLLPQGWPAVAESGVGSAADARRISELGYRLALIGSALMSHDDPTLLLQEIAAATRTVQT